MLTLTSLWTNGARVRFTERCCLISTSSKSLTVLPSSTRPVRWMVPVSASNVSARVVFPAPEWPTSTTFRTFSGWPAVGALPAAPDVAFSAIPPPPDVHVGCCCQPLPTAHPATSPRPQSARVPWSDGSPPDQVVKRIDQPPVRSNGHAEGAETGSCPAADTTGPGSRADPDNPQHADCHRNGRHDGWRSQPVPDRPSLCRDRRVHRLRSHRHAGRNAGQDPGQHRRFRRLPRLHAGPR